MLRDTEKWKLFNVADRRFWAVILIGIEWATEKWPTGLRAIGSSVEYCFSDS